MDPLTMNELESANYTANTTECTSLLQKKYSTTTSSPSMHHGEFLHSTFWSAVDYSSRIINAVRAGVSGLEERMSKLTLFPGASAQPTKPPSVLEYARMAALNIQFGNYEMALYHQLKALELLEKEHPPHPISLANCYSIIGESYFHLEKYEDALQYQLQALAIRKKELVPNHTILVKYNNNIGVSLIHLGRHEEALEYQFEVVKILEKNPPKNQRDLVNSYDSLQTSLMALGRYEKAFTYQEKALDIVKHTLPLDALQLATRYSSLSLTKKLLKNYLSASIYQTLALDIHIAYLPANHPDLARSYSSLGQLDRTLGHSFMALDYLKNAKAIWEQLPQHKADLAGCLNNIATILTDLGNHQEALGYLIQSLEIKLTLPSAPADLALTYDNIGATFNLLKEHKDALQYVSKALEIRKRELPPNHPALVISHINVGVVLYTVGESEKALAHLSIADQINDNLPRNHPDIARGHYGKGSALADLERYKEAIEPMKKAFDFHMHQENTLLRDTYLETFIRIIEHQNDHTICKSVTEEILPTCIKQLEEGHPLVQKLKIVCIEDKMLL